MKFSCTFHITVDAIYAGDAENRVDGIIEALQEQGYVVDSSMTPIEHVPMVRRERLLSIIETPAEINSMLSANDV